ncbi:MAG TPA: hypothetical protein VLC46_27440 [Thermoanaerobaculia bacterium]|nr:hypothetical protein [Thermoanaerobaculia bacterium]
MLITGVRGRTVEEDVLLDGVRDDAAEDKLSTMTTAGASRPHINPGTSSRRSRQHRHFAFFGSVSSQCLTAASTYVSFNLPAACAATSWSRNLSRSFSSFATAFVQARSPLSTHAMTWSARDASGCSISQAPEENIACAPTTGATLLFFVSSNIGQTLRDSKVVTPPLPQGNLSS